MDDGDEEGPRTRKSEASRAVCKIRPGEKVKQMGCQNVRYVERRFASQRTKKEIMIIGNAPGPCDRYPEYTTRVGALTSTLTAPGFIFPY